MSKGTLYRKYRSKTFKDVIGQEHITTTLGNSLKNNSFAHAYLLTGPRGVGKTSVARLFAYMVNGIDYTEDRTYSDIIEIDAASNRRIDEIRELREKINIAPSALKYKVYIIDEVHMLTREAFNALLKTLEEPPEHAIFILATTDFHKVPDTIISRCVRFSFLSIPPARIQSHLKDIAKKESINVSDEALQIIADNSDGSFRDAISLLDQFRNSAEAIEAQYVARILGISPQKEIASLIGYIEKSDPKKIIDGLDKLRQSGSGDTQVVKQLIAYLRGCLLGDNNTVISKAGIIDLIENLLSASDYSDIRLATEIILIGACSEKELPRAEHKPGPRPQTTKEDPPAAKNQKGPILDQDIIQDDSWESILNSLKDGNNTLYALARMAEAKINEDELELYFKFPFHYKQMKLEKNYLQIEKTVKSVNGRITKVSLFINEDLSTQAKENAVKQSASAKEPVANISNIFGPSEVLES